MGFLLNIRVQLNTYYQDMHLNLFPKGIVHVENIGGAIVGMESGRYFITAFVQKGMEMASCWLRMVVLK